jgi:hypothetical protein
VALVNLLGARKTLATIFSAAQRRVRKLRCGWLPVNRRVSREDPDRLNGCKACSPGNLVEETVDHIFLRLRPSRRAAMTFWSWKTSYLVIHAPYSGALAWIEGREIPDVEALNLPDFPVGKLVHKAYVEQTSLGGISFFEDSRRLPGAKLRNMNPRITSFTGASQIMAKVELVEHMRGCLICSLGLGTSKCRRAWSGP